MPDQDQTGFSRVCPSCGRRVPRNVSTCRCGATLPADATAARAEETETSSSSSSTAIVGILLIAALAGAGYWFMRTPPVGIQVPRGREADSPEAAAPTAEARTASPEARAWDAAANAKEIPAPSNAPNAPLISLPPPSNVSASVEEMVDRVMPAIVLIETTSGRGSGFFVARDTLITNVHVVENDGYVTLRGNNGNTMTARVESRAPAFDIAILKIAQPSPSQAVIPMASARGLRPGQEIIVIGSALGLLQNSVSRGIVSGIRTAGGATLVQTDAAVNPGNSGGPMLDRYGNVIGITTMGYRGAEGLNFAVAIDHARDLLEGRMTNVGVTGGLRDIEAQSAGSDSERQQKQGEEQFRGQIRQLAQAADRIDAGWQRYRKECYTSPIAGNYDRAWFAMLVPGGMPSNANAGCTQYYSAMEGEVRKFKDLMQRATDDARRANVLPGTVRDQLRSNRLDFEWDR